MKLKFLKKLRINDQVKWNDPDNGVCTGIYQINEIKTDNGKIETTNDILVLSNENGSNIEVFAHEIT